MVIAFFFIINLFPVCRFKRFTQQRYIFFFAPVRKIRIVRRVSMNFYLFTDWQIILERSPYFTIRVVRINNGFMIGPAAKGPRPDMGNVFPDRQGPDGDFAAPAAVSAAGEHFRPYRNNTVRDCQFILCQSCAVEQIVR